MLVLVAVFHMLSPQEVHDSETVGNYVDDGMLQLFSGLTDLFHKTFLSLSAHTPICVSLNQESKILKDLRRKKIT